VIVMPSKVDTLAIGEAAKFLRVSVKTLQRWDEKEKLIAKRTKSDRRYYTRMQLADFVREHDQQWKPDRTAYFEKSDRS